MYKVSAASLANPASGNANTHLCGRELESPHTCCCTALNVLLIDDLDTLLSWGSDPRAKSKLTGQLVSLLDTAAARCTWCAHLMDASLDCTVPTNVSPFERPIYMIELHISSVGCSVVCVTSCPEAVDPVLRRPGRLDTQVHVHPPSTLERQRILQDLLNTSYCDDSLELESVAAACEGYTAADLIAVCRGAARSALLRCSLQVILGTLS